MSEQTHAVNEAWIRYLSERTIQEDDFLVELKRAAEAAGIPRIQISPEQAAFMEILLRGTGAREVVEVGTLAGYSSIRMARALGAGGRVRTIELDPGRAAFARAQVERAGLEAEVQVFEGKGLDVLRTFDSGSADFAFIDADKEGYADYLDECVRIVRIGGMILVDNAFGFGRLLDPNGGDEVAAIRAFNDAMAARDDVLGIIVPFGDGCWVAVRVG
ncbi:MAG: O-methyltransferase [Phycisphaerales bacterium]|nr:O-methyltransferase [Planctomycetota bacterium]MCA9289080.1 O-methyltransferase [Phycisphaerales bacterium]